MLSTTAFFNLQRCWLQKSKCYKWGEMVKVATTNPKLSSVKPVFLTFYKKAFYHLIQTQGLKWH